MVDALARSACEQLDNAQAVISVSFATQIHCKSVKLQLASVQVRRHWGMPAVLGVPVAACAETAPATERRTTRVFAIMIPDE
jgi:hypothetical protein